MKKIFLLLIILLINSSNVFALEIVYPKQNPCKIDASSTFFIGSTNPDDILKINDIEVKLAPNGAFAQAVPLKVGKNEFKITTNPSNSTKPSQETKPATVFIINRPQPVIKTDKPLLEYPIMNDFFTIKENAPLRTTPIDGGINRMAHLPKEMQLSINGERNGFYRVYLNSKTIGWIDKNNVEQRKIEKPFDSSIKLIKAKCKLTNEYYKYEFEFEQPTPFTVKEENGLTLELFNIQEYIDNTFTFNIPIEKLVGYEAYWEENKFCLNIRRKLIIDCEKPLKNLKIAIDAGHGGKECGAIGCCGAKEKDINLAIAKNLQQELKSQGAKVIMTREEDIDVSLQDRVKIANKNESVFLISIHANAVPDGIDPNKNSGTSIYYYHPQAKVFAENILTSMTTELGTNNDRVRQGSLALTRPSASVSVLIEVAYMINPNDYALLTDKKFQQDCAKAITDGIKNYLTK